MPPRVQSCASAKPAIGPVTGLTWPIRMTSSAALRIAGLKIVDVANAAAPALSTVRRDRPPADVPRCPPSN